MPPFLIAASLTAASVFNLFLGSLVCAKNRSNKESVIFFILTVSASLWSLTIMVTWLPIGESFLNFWSNATFIGPTLFIAFFFYFSFVFPEEEKQVNNALLLVSLIPASIIILLALMQKINIATHNPYTIETGFGIYVFVVYFFAYAYASLRNLYKKLKTKKGIAKKQVQFVYYGFFISIVMAAFFNLFLPLVFNNAKLTFAGPSIATTVFITSIAYAIFKHQLFNVRVIATEIFAVMVVLVFFVNTVFSRDAVELIVNVLMLILVSLFSFFLVKGTLREINALEEISEQKSEFLSIASHQLRTPLTVMKGYLSMLREGTFGKLTAEELDAINKSYRTNENMIKLVNDFLNLSRAEKGTLEFKFEKTDIGKLINEVVGRHKIAAEDEKLELNWEMPEKSIFAKVDKEKFEQVISNLVDNALKYTEEGGVSVWVSGDSMPNKIRIHVKDTGVGIDPDEIKDIFTRFRRGKRGERMNAEGAGLGLHIVELIVAGHGGTIQVKSEGIGKGSEFIVEIPIDQGVDTEESLSIEDKSDLINK